MPRLRSLSRSPARFLSFQHSLKLYQSCLSCLRAQKCAILNNIVQLSWRRLRQNIPAFIKGTLRRQADSLLPSHEVSEYRAWITRRLAQRQLAYTNPVPPGLLSLLTAVWDG